MLLGVNIDHVATVRQARGTRYPDPLDAARIALRSGADSITLHLREDRRHIQDDDVHRVNELPDLRLNLEMAATEEMLLIAAGLRPSDCCLVPEKRQELTTEGGLDVRANKSVLTAACGRLMEAGIRVSLFVDPDPAQLDAARSTGAEVVELHTGNYADALTREQRDRELLRVQTAATHGADIGLIMHAGHGLNYDNVAAIAAIPELRELNIGHSIVARAVLDGFAVAVSEMKTLMSEARQS